MTKVKTKPAKATKSADVEIPTVEVPVVEVPEMEAAEEAETKADEAKRKPGRPKTKPVVEKVPGKKGRPIVPGSRRQVREAELEAKRNAGMLKKGRPKEDEAVLAERRAERKAEKEAIMLAKQEALKKIQQSMVETAETANQAIAELTEAQ